MKSLMRLLLCVLEDSSIWCCTSTTRDWLTITRRVEYEGFSFLTITLPTFGQWFERSLAEGYADPRLLLGFKYRRSLPEFLRGLTSRVFDPSTGLLLDTPDVNAIFYIRQIAYMFKKVLLPCTQKRIEGAFERYVQCEQEVNQAFGKLSCDQLSAFRNVSRLLWGSVLQRVNRKVRDGDLTPKHGPGATAERIVGNHKFDIRTWHERLQAFFPADWHAIPNWGHADRLGGVDFLEPGAEPPVRVITVPKTLKTPRIIAIEPVCMQYTQQSLLRILVPGLELHPLTRGRLNFTDQTVNQRAVLRSSRDGSLATLDMKDASDRVPVQLVELMFDAVPDLRDAVMACRSTTADVPGFGSLTLTKFASMGSALCFPVEAMVFYTIAVTAMLKRQEGWLTLELIDKIGEGVRIYGDDIIVPVDYVHDVMSELSAYGMIVNQHKSFWTGKFRESCGVDAYDGIPVTPAYCRRLLPTSLRDTSEMLSAISLANQLYKSGSWRAAQWLRDWVARFAPLPIVEETSPVHGRFSYCFKYEKESECRFTHSPRVKGIVTKATHRPSVIDGAAALLKWFLKPATKPDFPFMGSSVPFQDERHLERHGRPESVNIKIRWSQPF